ncbi:hypothetical protein ETB97_001255 [Aspergillus alliaceus]|uniref:Uncharacterized protein n=1 Tax=Petromyces alliaceus TaxID=209559 RepID=A0A5N6FMN4_PETAA|nr:uncharacterized protein BDW43DRAFT_321635 [Aspergillus alliaceus]KAB8230190.1 hypothetical protein BDW43DRAFT_321635 [Aspergillus alliaceus]KAF5860687.1 hypothetical protein ETB97_001255 [Aspergillus burnettii]
MVPRFGAPRRRQSDSTNNEPEFPSDMGNQNSTGDDAQRPTDSEGFYPDIYDVLKVRYLLRWKIIPEGLPAEIVDLIIDAAEYWPSTEATLGEKRIIRQDKDQVLVRTAPLCYDEKTLGSDSPKVLPHRTIHPCRKIVFSISSHDQGFASSGHGTFDGSYTWFDAEVIRSANLATSTDAPIPEPDANGIRFGQGHPLLLPKSSKLQSNRAAVSGTQHYEITWHHLDNIRADSAEAEEIQHNQGRGKDTLDGTQVRTLQVGDVISVLGRARFGGWSNHVERLSVRVFWAV